MSNRPSQAKRLQLIDAASRLFHRQGVEVTSLKDVAEASGVPLGSVYYYYPTKDELTASVIAERNSRIVRLIEQQTDIAPAEKRLLAFVSVWMEDREIDARYGCPIGSLCFEVARTRRLAADAPFQTLIDWCRTQFRSLGAGRASERYAVHLIAALQGISLMAAVFADPRLIEQEVSFLRSWVRETAKGRRAPLMPASRRTAGRRRITRRQRSAPTKTEVRDP